jgi:hypothetical protein
MGLRFAIDIHDERRADIDYKSTTAHEVAQWGFDTTALLWKDLILFGSADFNSLTGSYGYRDMNLCLAFLGTRSLLESL